MSFADRIFRGLDRALAEAARRPLDLRAARCVVLSDQHKGKRDKADDFLRSETAYNAALGYYLEGGYTLYALGDVEELWECRAGQVLRAYPHSVDLESQFHAAGRYLRFYGNHDDDWSTPRLVQRFLQPIFPGLEVLGGLVLEVSDGGTAVGSLFLVHGHQGTTFSDRFRVVGRFVVRNFWRPFQRLTGARVSTPATSYELRERHDLTMHSWAQKQSGLVLITGHTHRPVFLPEPGSAPLAGRLAALRGDLTREEAADVRERAAALRAELEWLRTMEHQRAGMVKPCYFNSGCCCFSDGNITGLEIVDGEIRLVRWPSDEVRPERKVLRRASLSQVLAACRAS